MNRKIIKYISGWHPQRNSGYIKIILDTGQPVVMQNLSAQEFTAIMLILQSNDPAYLDSNGWIKTSETDVAQ